MLGVDCSYYFPGRIRFRKQRSVQCGADGGQESDLVTGLRVNLESDLVTESVLSCYLLNTS